MSMYNLVFDGNAANERGSALLAMLGFAAFSDVGRFRDAWVERGDDGEPLIAVYTRNGGGNREECLEGVDSAACDCPACKANHVLPAHELHVSGADDDFDSTYRTEYFRVPDRFVEVLRDVAGEHVDTSARWLAAIEAINPKGGEASNG